MSKYTGGRNYGAEQQQRKSICHGLLSFWHGFGSGGNQLIKHLKSVARSNGVELDDLTNDILDKHYDKEMATVCRYQHESCDGSNPANWRK